MLNFVQVLDPIKLKFHMDIKPFVELNDFLLAYVY